MDPDFEWALCPCGQKVSTLTTDSAGDEEGKHVRHKRSLATRPPVQVSGAPTIGGFFIGQVVNLAVIRRSWFLSRMDAGHLRIPVTDDTEPRHSANTRFAEAFTEIGAIRVGNVLAAYFYSFFLLLFLGVYAASGLVRDALAKWIPQPGEGPSMESCLKGHTKVTNVSESEDGKYAVITTYEGAGDPGYSHTAKLISEAGLALILPPPPGFELTPLARTGGLLTPSTGIGRLLVERLRVNNVATIKSELVELSSEGKKNV